MSGKAVVALLAVAAVGGAAWWFTTKKATKKAKLRSAKAAGDAAFRDFDALIEKETAPAPRLAASGPTPSFANYDAYDAYYAQYMAWAQSQPPAYQSQLPPPPMPPQQARASFRTIDQVNSYQRQYAAQVQQAIDRVYASRMAAQPAQPTVVAARTITAAETSGPAMAVAAADQALAQWRQNNAFLAAQGVPTLPPPQPTQIPDYNSPVAGAALRQNYFAAQDWFSRYGSTKAGVSAPPQLPAGIPA